MSHHLQLAVTTSTASPTISSASLESAALKPNRLVASSAHSDWRALVLDLHEGEDRCDAFDTHPTPDLALVVARTGAHHLDVFKRGRWRHSVYQPGVAGLVQGGEIARLKWSSATPGTRFTTSHLYLPSGLIMEIAEQYRKAGGRHVRVPIDGLAFRDPTISASVSSIEKALRSGQPNLYAEQAARWMITHLLTAHAGLGDARQGSRHPGSLSDRRLARVIEYMSDRLDTDLTLSELASEACISVHHFGRLFRAKVGCTPHVYLTDLRMDLARRLLRTTDLSISDISRKSGYARPAAFSAAFLANVGSSPCEFRSGQPDNHRQNADYHRKAANLISSGIQD